MSGAAMRRKGLDGEREVAAIWERHGFTVRNLEGSGDHLVIGPGFTLHDEVKRQERARLPEWLAQAELEAPAGTVPVVAFRQNRRDWYIALRLDAFAGLVSGETRRQQ